MKKSKKDTFSAVLVKVLFIILISVIVATVTTALAFPFISDSTLFGMHSSTNIRTLVLLSIFLFVFLAIATPMVRSLMAKTHLESAGHEGQAAPGWSMLQSAARSTRPRPSPKRHGGGVKAKTSGKADAAAAASQKALKESRENGKKKETPGEQKPEPSKEDKNATARQGDVLEAENDTKPRADESEKPEKDKSKDADRLSSYAERQKTVMVKFLGQTLQQIQDDNKNMDSFNKFGVNLLLSGACDILGHKRRLDPRSASKILSAGVQIMGFNKSNAESFAAKYEEYLLSDARYMQMFQAGRNAMNTFLTDEVAATKHMKMALEEWNKPKPKEETTGPITVMFTDMVGSTALTQSMGDAVAQQVVRAHNRVVRDALTQFGGREIKHTGDGIMASFPTTSNGVEAAKIMQTNVAVHNKGNPDLPLHIKIGINAGEPIAEDNDLFGTTVQLAARIVDKAKTEQIFVSEIVRGICAGKDLEFVDRGGYAMKGFENELTLYEVVWNEDAGGEEEIDTNKAS
jgi:adenylate cyclase